VTKMVIEVMQSDR